MATAARAAVAAQESDAQAPVDLLAAALVKALASANTQTDNRPTGRLALLGAALTKAHGNCDVVEAMIEVGYGRKNAAGLARSIVPLLLREGHITPAIAQRLVGRMPGAPKLEVPDDQGDYRGGGIADDEGEA